METGMEIHHTNLIHFGMPYILSRKMEGHTFAINPY